MRISGLQKMTLLDYPGKIACTVFLGGCNFRCPFCHNGELLDGSTETIMEEQEFLDFLSKRRECWMQSASVAESRRYRQDCLISFRKSRTWGI